MESLPVSAKALSVGVAKLKPINKATSEEISFFDLKNLNKMFPPSFLDSQV
ncbi:hypothetical protein D3C81_906880 [compost metagenome]